MESSKEVDKKPDIESKAEIRNAHNLKLLLVVLLSSCLIAAAIVLGTYFGTHGSQKELPSPQHFMMKASTCASWNYICKNGQCLTKINPECDNVVDCLDRSDEMDCSCGTPRLANRVVGGADATEGEWPWQVSLRLKYIGHECGATLVSDTWLISAAHCFTSFPRPHSWQADLGTIYRESYDPSVVRRDVKRIIVHRSYSRSTLDYDVALVELSRPVIFSRSLQPACLPSPVHVFHTGRNCTVTGWGFLQERNGSLPYVLQEARVPIFNRNECNRHYNGNITPRMICAGFSAGKVDACKGDSGGPLVCEEVPGKWFLAGIVSWGEGCAQPNRPGVYTRVTAIRDWAMSIIRPSNAVTPTAVTRSKHTIPTTNSTPTSAIATCASWNYICKNGQCLTKINPECDNVVDCLDRSDEMDCSCGTPRLANRVVGGADATEGEWPWQVSMRLKYVGHQCGATLVSDTWLISAAHCFIRFPRPHSWQADLGTIYRESYDPSVVRRDVKRIIVHRSYRRYSLDYDVALVELSRPVTFSRALQPACLPSPVHVFHTGRNCTVTGWGFLQERNRSLPYVLQEARVPIVNRNECNRRYNGIITPRMICAGFSAGGVGACKGDSGGPLVCEEAPGKWFLAGIVSWGAGCAQPNRPGVYTRVTAIRDWAMSIIRPSNAVTPTAVTRSKHTIPTTNSTPTSAIEVHCTNTTYKCSNDTCISKHNAECDDVRDCPTGSDELNCDCGNTTQVVNTKIVGGVNSKLGEFPWQVSLRLTWSGHICGGTLISPNWVVTAAHCFRGRTNPVYWTGYLGTIYLTEFQGVRVTFKNIIIHPNFKAYNLDYDIALLELTSPVNTGQTIQPACLPSPSHRFSNEMTCFITGWGLQAEAGYLAHVLQKAEVDLISDNLCHQLYGNRISPRMFCAGKVEGGVDSCKGDSGGPLVCREDPGKWFIFGITSWGDGCAREGAPGVYSRITALRSFIERYVF